MTTIDDLKRDLAFQEEVNLRIRAEYPIEYKNRVYSWLIKKYY